MKLQQGLQQVFQNSLSDVCTAQTICSSGAWSHGERSRVFFLLNLHALILLKRKKIFLEMICIQY